MIHITRRDIDFALSRYDEQRAEAARRWKVAESGKLISTKVPQRHIHFRSMVRHAVAVVVSLATIG
ncbi:MAG: hypothetical protein R2839_06065 [Thermomicrobiales bacterium]